MCDQDIPTARTALVIINAHKPCGRRPYRRHPSDRDEDGVIDGTAWEQTWTHAAERPHVLIN